MAYALVEYDVTSGLFKKIKKSVKKVVKKTIKPVVKQVVQPVVQIAKPESIMKLIPEIAKIEPVKELIEKAKEVKKVVDTSAMILTSPGVQMIAESIPGLNIIYPALKNTSMMYLALTSDLNADMQNFNQMSQGIESVDDVRALGMESQAGQTIESYNYATSEKENHESVFRNLLDVITAEWLR